MNCEICGKPLTRRARATGAYHIWSCECGLEFFHLKGDKDYNCPEFMICCIASNLHCQECPKPKFRVEVKQEVNNG